MRIGILSTGSLVLAGLTALALGAARPAAAEDLTVVSWGGSYQASQREAFFKPFAKDTGNKVLEEEYNGEIAKVRAMVETGNVSWDVVDLDTRSALAACAEGIIETIDWGKLGLDKSKFIGGDVNECGVPNILYSWVLAYDKDKTPNGPTSSADIFDLQKFPGKRGLRSRTCTRSWRPRKASIAPSRSSTRSRAVSCGGKPAPSRRSCSPTAKWS